MEKFSLSNDNKLVLLVHDIKPINKYGYKARYKIYDTKNSAISSITVPGLKDDHQIDYVDWGPSGTQMVRVEK